MSLFYVSALKIIPLVDAQTLVFVFPLILIALSAVFLSERVQPLVWIAGILGLSGAALVIGPGGTVDLKGGLLALAAAGTTAVYMLLNRKLADGGPALLMILPPVFGTIALGALLPQVWVPPTPQQWLLMVGTGASFALAHGLIILAFARVAANRLAPLAYLQVVSGVTLGYVVFADWPDTRVWTGLALIIFAGLIAQRTKD